MIALRGAQEALHKYRVEDRCPSYVCCENQGAHDVCVCNAIDLLGAVCCRFFVFVCYFGLIELCIHNLPRQSLLSRRQRRAMSSGLFPAPAKRTVRDHALICRLMRAGKELRKSSKFGAICLETAVGIVDQAASQYALKRGGTICSTRHDKRRRLALGPELPFAPTSFVTRSLVPATGHAVGCGTGESAMVRGRGNRHPCVTDLLPAGHLRIAWPRGSQGSLAAVAGSCGVAKTTVAYIRKSAAHVMLEAQGRLVAAAFARSRPKPLRLPQSKLSGCTSFLCEPPRCTSVTSAPHVVGN